MYSSVDKFHISFDFQGHIYSLWYVVFHIRLSVKPDHKSLKILLHVSGLIYEGISL